MPFAVELSVCMGVTGFLWPVLWRVVWIGSASWQLLKGAPTSTSAADPITFFILFDNVCIAPFSSLVFLKFWDTINNFHNSLLCTLSSDK